METLPNELYAIIFEFACRDGGRTGCALASVSRRIAAVSKPWRYHSVALIGPRAMIHFASLARKSTERDEFLGARYLFISDFEARTGFEARVSRLWFDSSLGVDQPESPISPSSPWRLFNKIWDFSKERRNAIGQAQIRGVNTAIEHILTACAPSLVSVGMYLQTMPMFTLLPIHLPRIVDLAVAVLPRINHWKYGWPGDFPEQNDPKVPLTTLRRLHIMAMDYPLDQDYNEAIAWALGCAPELTHLRISSWASPLQLLWPNPRISALPPNLGRIDLHSHLTWEKFREDPDCFIYHPLLDRARMPADAAEVPRVHFVCDGEWNRGGLIYEQPRSAAEDWLSPEGTYWKDQEETIPTTWGIN